MESTFDKPTVVLNAHAAWLTTCTYTLLLEAVRTELAKLAVVDGGPWLTPPAAVVIVDGPMNHSYVVLASAPLPLAVAVNVTVLLAQMFVTSCVMLTPIVGTGVTVTLTGVEVAVAGLAHNAVLVITT